MIKVKICGITNLEDALMASSQGADAVGFIFCKRSPRYISEQSAKKIIYHLDPFLVKVGVFLNEERRRVLDVGSYLDLDVLQFHGDEAPSYCNFFRPKFKVIKAFFPEDKPLVSKLAKYNIDGFLFDIKYDKKVKGSKELSPAILKEVSAFVKKGKKVIIAGGLNLENIDKIKKIKPYAVDVASGVEKFVGKKDERLIREFIKKVKNG